MENPGHESGILIHENTGRIRLLKKYQIFVVRYFPRFSKLLSEFDSSAIVICSGDYVTLARYAEQKFIFYPTGFDLTRAPFLFDKLVSAGLSYKNCFKSFLKFPFAYMFQHNIRKGLQMCVVHLSHMFGPYEIAYRKLEKFFPIHRSDIYLPWAITTEHFSPEKFDVFSQPIVQRQDNKLQINLFMPSRFLIERTESNKETGYWKNNQIAIEAFSKLVRSTNDNFVYSLYLIDRNNEKRNFDVDGLYRRADIEPHIKWLKPKNPEGFSRLEMMQIYKEMDFVLDDFGVGWFGGISLESLAMGCLVINNAPQELMVALYGSNPFLFAENSDQIFQIITDFSRSREQIDTRRNLNIAWMQEHHSAKKIVQVIEKLV